MTLFEWWKHTQQPHTLNPHYKAYSKNTATVFEGEDNENIRKIRTMYKSNHDKSSRSIFKTATSREIYEFSFLPREITCWWLVSIVFMIAVAAEEFEPTHVKMKNARRRTEKHQGALYGLMEATPADVS